MIFLTLLVLIEIPLLMIALSPAVMSQGDDCTLPRLYACLESLQTLGNNLDKVTTKEQLAVVCRQLKSGVRCVDGHLSSCFTPGQRKVFDDVVFAARLFLEELCIEGPMQAEYLQHSHCYENISLSQGDCAGMYEDVVQISQIADKEANAGSGLGKTCCAFKIFLVCKYKHVSLNCGQEAADFLRHHLDRISSPLLHELCVRFSTEEDCIMISSGTSEYVHRYVALFYAHVLLMIIYFYHK